jgi:hypothetical protein
MKKQLLTLASGLLLAFGVNAQSVLIEGDFQDFDADGFTVYDGDGNERAGPIPAITSWGMVQFNSDPSNQFFASFAEYSSGTTAEDWLISPTATIPDGSGATLTWQSYSNDVGNSSCEVAISTTGGAAGYDNYTVVSTITNETINKWNTNTLDLSAYAGESINIAFIHTSPATKYYFIDNVNLSALVNLDLEIISLNEPSGYQVYGTQIKATVKNLGLLKVFSFDLTWKRDGEVIGTQRVWPSGGLLSGETKEFTSSTYFTSPDYGVFDIEVSISNPNQQMDMAPLNNVANVEINYWSYLPIKRVLFEEGTGTWCGFCPRGAVVLEDMLSRFPESFIGVAVHNGDPMVVSSHDGAIGNFISGYPGGVWDHKDGTGVSQEVADAEYATRINLLSPFNISSLSTFDSLSREITTVVTVTPVINTKNKTYKIGGIIAEDGVTGTTSGYAQVNYYQGGGRGPLNGAGHDWTTAGDPVPAANMVYDHVSRALLPAGSYNGATGSLPTTLVANQKYTHTFTHTLSAGYNEEEITIVTYIVDGEDNSVSNSSKEKLDMQAQVGIAERNNGVKFNMFPNPANQTVTLNVTLENSSNISLEIFNMVGAKVHAEQASLVSGKNTKTINISSLPNGIYTVSLVSGNVSTTERLVISK